MVGGEENHLLKIRFASDYLDPDKVIIEDSAEDATDDQETIFSLWIPRTWLVDIDLPLDHEKLEGLFLISDRNWVYRIEDEDHIGWDFYHMFDAEYLVGMMNKVKRRIRHGWRGGEPPEEEDAA